MKKQLLLLVMMMLPLVASAYDIEVQNADGVTIYYNYINDGTELAVTFRGTIYTDYPEEYTGNVVIPEEVTYMDKTYKVTSIGDYAFYGCSGLTSITIPNSVTSIGNWAFLACSGLTSITIPSSVTTIRDGAFQTCSGLKKVIVSDIAAWCGIIFGNLSRYHSNPLYYAKHLYSDENTEIKDLVIPNSVTVIGLGAFYYCTGLTSVTIPNSVTGIGQYAFEGCRIENVLTRNSKTAFNQAFSERTYQHAMLYIPEGTWGEAVYDGDWYMFNNIREVATNKEALSPTKAYVLMDIKSFGYAVFDGTNSEVKIAKAFYNIDENDLNNCWQVIDKSGAKYLFNIGAEKYAKITSDGKIILTDNETPLNITEGKNGLMFGTDTSREWGLVKNNNVNIDSQTGINPVNRTYTDSNSTYFSLDGQQTAQPKKGLNIVRKSDGTMEKIVVK